MSKNFSLDVKNAIFILIAIGVFLFIGFFPFSEGIRTVGEATLTQQGQIALGILLFALVLWISEALPFHITGLFGIVLLALFNVDTFKNIVSVGFGNHVVAFFIGVLILSAFITKTGLGKRIAMFILSLTGNSTRLIILGFLATGTLLSMWVTDMAVAAMLMPLARAICQEEDIKPLKSNFGKALLIASAWGPVIGGIGTPAGCSPNPIAIGFLQEMAGIEVSFLQWMIYGVPAALLLLPFAWILLIIFFKPEMDKLSKSKDELKNEFKELPPLSREEIVTSIVFVLTVTLWLASPVLSNLLGISIPVSMPVLLTAALFFFPGMSKLKWKEIEPEISWSGIILVLSGISLGMMLYQTGGAQWIALLTLGGVSSLNPFLMIFTIVLIVSFLKVALSSNAVTGTIIVPIMIELAQATGIPPLTIVLPAALTSSLAFILVTSTPTNVIPYSAGYFSIGDMAKVGVVMTFVSSLIVALVMLAVGTMTGLY
ncbi:MAG: SLC13 family permease [Spirochaetia bacterium]